MLAALFGIFALILAIIPSTAISPIITFVGLLLASEAVREVPQRKMPLFLLALLPGLCDWASQQGASFGVMGPAYFGLIAVAKSNILYAMVIAGIVYYSTWPLSLLCDC